MKVNRRQFLKTSAVFAGWSILPTGAWSNPLNSRFCTAHIGVGGMGRGDLKSISSHSKVQVVGLADVNRAALNLPYKDAARFADYREMLRTLGDKIDGVVISTPDHTHYPATLMAMNMGKAVYCQKPLTHEISEAYELAALAKEKNLVTQMGIQCHSADAYRMAVDFLQQGIIGKVSKVYAWSNKSWGDDAAAYTGSDPIPEGFDWNLWLGSAPARPYLKGKYHPGQWRKSLDFGCGTLGDMGVHIIDTPYAALKLGQPRSVKVTCRQSNHFSHPSKNIVEYEFPSTEYTTDKLQFTWFDGAYAPQTPKQINPDLELEAVKMQPAEPINPDLELEAGKTLPRQGAMFVGEDGQRMLLPHMSAPQPLPRSLLGNISKPVLEPTNHYHQWVDAGMGNGTCSADFEYAAPLTTGVLLGVVGNRFPGQTLQWDGDAMRFTNNEDANKLVSRSYRKDY
jgi:predicted dehydrogenase